MSKRPRISIHWFRRDLRLSDNHGLLRALEDHGDVLPLFIFDTDLAPTTPDASIENDPMFAPTSTKRSPGLRK